MIKRGNINSELSNIFYEMADILEMQGVKWKPQAYRRVAKMLETHIDSIEKMYRKSGLKGLMEIQGIGENIAKKIEEYIKTGKIKAYIKLKKSVPFHINVLMQIPGMGPKKVKKLNKILNIKTISQLEKAAKQHKISKIQGFGLKSEQDILENIAITKGRGKEERVSLKKAQKIAKEILNNIKAKKEIMNMEIAGSLRRKRDTIRDIDIIASSKNPEKVIDAFTKIRGIKKILAKGLRKAIIIFGGMQADIRVFKPESYGAGLLYFTGSKNYNIELRKIAIKKGYKLNEYGLFDRKTGKMIAGKTEQEICRKLGAKYLSPEQREI